MKVKKLELNNFRGFRKATIEFPDSNLAVFIGTNGKGKSSVLDLVAIFLADFLAKMGYNKPIYGSLFMPTDINISENINSQSVYLESFNEITLVSGEIDGLPRGEEIHIDETVRMSRESFGMIRSNRVLDYCLRLKDILKSEGASVNLPILAYYVDTRYFDNSYSLNSKKGTRKNAYPQFDAYDDAFDRKIRNFNDFIFWYKKEEDIENEQIKRLKDFDYKNPKLEVIRKTILNVFEKLGADKFNDLRFERVLKEEDYYFRGDENIGGLFVSKNNQNLSLKQLSAGEKMLLMVVCDVARRLTIANPGLSDPLQGEGIVLIDEIELHLHPKWQREVIPALLATFPNIQFLITTHSPQVLSRVDKEDIFLLENGEVFKLSSNPKGLDTNAILEEIMDTPKYPQHVDDLVEKLFTLIQQKKFDQAGTVRSKVVEASPDNPALQRADSMIERLKVLNQ